ncbi:RIIa domain-containing protein 1-like [Ylistrum balloti]|uniref:RIIa domain-containing protein 1-like n=1 Tax=Ylistrum balloti TaxID=509963 RepID=UPI002905C8A2|nr:RIIa domain-containing protein 1-like [Ylistrum balloti]
MADKPQHQPPHGMEPYDLSRQDDLGALSQEQQEKLNKFKTKTRLENERYLRDHPEVECLVAGFLSDVLRNRPENIKDFAADYFTDEKLPDMLESQLQERQHKFKQNRVLQKL